MLTKASLGRRRSRPASGDRLAMLGMLAASLALGACSTPKNQVVISVADQKMMLVDPEGDPVALYPVSTSKFGVGDERGSYRTPLGRMEVARKIGHGAPEGAVFKSRRLTGEVLPPDAPGRDPIVTRILWLRGTESHNRNAYGRFIYIHGTPEERNIGRPASYGCIRMKSSDVVDLFDRIGNGSEVVVTTKPLPRKARKLEEPEIPEPGDGDGDGPGLLARLKLPGLNRLADRDERASEPPTDAPAREEPANPPANAGTRGHPEPSRLAATDRQPDARPSSASGEDPDRPGFFKRFSIGSLFSRDEPAGEPPAPAPAPRPEPTPPGRSPRPHPAPPAGPTYAANHQPPASGDWHLTQEQARRLFLLHEAEQAVDSAR